MPNTNPPDASGTEKRMTTTTRRRSPNVSDAAVGQDRPKWLPPGVHVAPFRSRAGHPVLVTIWSPGLLFAMAEVLDASGRVFWMWPVVKQLDDHWKLIPDEKQLLPRGVHRAPWRMSSGAARTQAPVFVAIDSQHRLVEMLGIEPGDPELEAEAQRTLSALLDAHDECEKAAEAERGPDDPIPVLDSWGFIRMNKPCPGIWSRHNREFYFVDSEHRHCATLEFHNGASQRINVFRIVRAANRIMHLIDPDAGDEDDGDDDAEEWKR